jgi:hypothetical protein
VAEAGMVYGDDAEDALSNDLDLDNMLDQALRDVGQSGSGFVQPTAFTTPAEDIYGNAEMDTAMPFVEPEEMYGNAEMDPSGLGHTAQPSQEQIYGNEEMMQADGQAQMNQAAAFRSHHGGPVEAYDVNAGSVGQFQVETPIPGASGFGMLRRALSCSIPLTYCRLGDYVDAFDKPPEHGLHLGKTAAPQRPQRQFEANAGADPDSIIGLGLSIV